ncbi:MAG: GNAT family N-acetyltransferase [Chloroflexi bacterium]|nr:GNAT family N-acetyltransferase [Chloroflexota bacterium]
MIRLALESDARRIGQLWAEMVAYHAQFDAFTFRVAANGAALYERRLLERLDDPLSRVLVAEADGEVAAYASAMIADITTEMFQPLRCGLLADIYVGEPWRRRGLGRRLVERLCLWFRDRDVAHFEWHVSARNREALAFWKAIGGEPTILRMRASVPGEG